MTAHHVRRVHRSLWLQAATGLVVPRLLIFLGSSLLNSFLHPKALFPTALRLTVSRIRVGKSVNSLRPLKLNRHLWFTFSPPHNVRVQIILTMTIAQSYPSNKGSSSQ